MARTFLGIRLFTLLRIFLFLSAKLLALKPEPAFLRRMARLTTHITQRVPKRESESNVVLVHPSSLLETVGVRITTSGDGRMSIGRSDTLPGRWTVSLLVTYSTTRVATQYYGLLHSQQIYRLCFYEPV